MYKIDEVTKQVGLTKRTLRYYEEIGLIHPLNVVRGTFACIQTGISPELKNCGSERSVRNYASRDADFLSLKERMEQRRSSENPRDREVIQEIKEMLEQQVQTLDEKMEQMQRVKAELEDSLHRAVTFLESTKGE